MNVSVNILLKSSVHAALRNVVYDIETLIRRLDLTGIPLRRSISFYEYDRLNAEEMAEIMLGVGMTASQVAYMRDGEVWTLIDVKEGSDEGLTIVNRLDDLREKIASRMHEFHTLKHKQYVTDLTRRAFSLVALALDAVPAEHMPLALEWSCLWSKTGDPQGDAQLACEDEHSADYEKIKKYSMLIRSWWSAGMRMHKHKTRQEG